MNRIAANIVNNSKKEFFQDEKFFISDKRDIPIPNLNPSYVKINIYLKRLQGTLLNNLLIQK